MKRPNMLFEPNEMEEEGKRNRFKERRSRAFTQEFEDWEFETIILPNGKKKIKRTYKGEYYSPDFPLAKKIGLRILYLIFVMAAVFLLIFGVMSDALFNYLVYSAIGEFATGIVLVLVIYHLIFYISTIKHFTIGEMNTTRRPLYRNALVAAVFSWITCVFGIVITILHRDMAGIEDAIGILCFFGCGAFMFALYIIEKKINYKTTP